MYEDDYFPKMLVDKGKVILINLCLQIESDKPSCLDELYTLSYAATEKFNDLGTEFDDMGSEIETAARESIGADFEFIAKTYGFVADTEELIAPREW